MPFLMMSPSVICSSQVKFIRVTTIINISFSMETDIFSCMGLEKLGLFGITSCRETARIILIPVPWEVTTSYGGGTSRGPEAILNASSQIDLFDRQIG